MLEIPFPWGCVKVELFLVLKILPNFILNMYQKMLLFRILI